LFLLIEAKKLKNSRIVNLQGTLGLGGQKGSNGAPGAAVSKIVV